MKYWPNQNLAVNLNNYRSGLTSFLFMWKRKSIFTWMRGLSVQNNSYSNLLPYFDLVFGTAPPSPPPSAVGSSCICKYLISCLILFATSFFSYISQNDLILLYFSALRGYVQHVHQQEKNYPKDSNELWYISH